MKKIFYVTIVIVALFACGILSLDPQFADVIYDEDNLFENLTVAITALGFILSLVLLFISYKKRSAYRFWFFMAILLLLFVGDEVSWGMNFFGIEKTKVAGIDFDGAHDIFSIGIGYIKMVRDNIKAMGVTDPRSMTIMAGVAITLLTFLGFALWAATKKRKKIYAFFSRNLKWEPFFFLFIGVALIGLATFVDDDNMVSFPHKRAVEESVELLAASAFLFSCLSGFRRKNNA